MSDMAETNLGALAPLGNKPSFWASDSSASRRVFMSWFSLTNWSIVGASAAKTADAPPNSTPPTQRVLVRGLRCFLFITSVACVPSLETAHTSDRARLAASLFQGWFWFH